MNPKVLVATVTYDGKDYIWDKYYSNIKNLEYDNYDFLVVDNTRRTGYYKKLLKQKVNALHAPRGKNSRTALVNSYNMIRDYFLKGGYEYLLVIESDLIPPVDIITRLLRHNKEVIGCMYNIGYDYSESQPPRPCLFGVKKLKEQDGAGKITLETFNYTAEEGFGFYGNGVIKIHGCGLGTTMIHRSIMEQFNFWYYEDENDKIIKHCDVIFYMDLHNANRVVYVDTDIIIPHFNSDWKNVKDA